MNDETKIVDVKGRRYQLRRMLPDDGSFILCRILAAGMGAGVGAERADRSLIQSMLAAFLRGLDFDTFKLIQHKALSVVSRLESNGTGTEQPMPLVTDNGVFADQELSRSISLTMALTVHSLVFNLSDFFSEGGLSSLIPD